MLPENLSAFLLRLLVSPLLPGAFFYLLGILTSKHPPQKVNNFYGYRTPRSMRSPEAWAEANRFAPLLMIRMAKACLVLSIPCALLIPLPALGLTTAGIGLLAVITLWLLTERRLKSIDK